MTQRTSKPTRKFLPTIIIYCEGETEKNYLDALKDDRYASKHIKIKRAIEHLAADLPDLTADLNAHLDYGLMICYRKEVEVIMAGY